MRGFRERVPAESPFMINEELHKIQKKHGYIPENEMYDLSARINVPVYEIHGVASYYPGYRLTPPPVADIRVCADFPCRLLDGEKLKKEVEALASGFKSVEVKDVSCLGQCDRAPAICINEHSYGGQSKNDLLALCREAMSGKAPHEQHFPGLTGPFMTDPYEKPEEHYGAVKDLCKTSDAIGVIKKLKDAGLKGMGGAGFPTGVKWEAVKNAPGKEKYICCNADECEVATFKDREIMKNVPHLLVEGMILAALVTGAERGYIYIRHEYHDQIHIVEKEIERAEKLGVCGDNICGTGKKYKLTVFVSPGGYVQGEESALLEAIEGKRGQPRVKPPFPVFVGLWGKPTIINNVETLAYTPIIVVKGPDYFKALGKDNCPGLKWMGVNGHVNRPGAFEVPMGTTYREAIYDLCGGISGGRKLKAFAPSGPSGGFLPASMVDLKMDWKIMADAGSMLGSGAIVAIAEGTCMVDLALNATRFYRNESCGKCVPCRLGSQKIVDIIWGITQGHVDDKMYETIDRLSDTLMMTSICGLGQIVPAPIQSVIKYFKDDIEKFRKKK